MADMADDAGIADLIKRWDAAWLVDGRPITNMEMFRLRHHKRDQRWERIVARDCADCRGPEADGSCHKLYGTCVHVQDAERLLWEIEHGY